MSPFFLSVSVYTYKVNSHVSVKWKFACHMSMSLFVLKMS